MKSLDRAIYKFYLLKAKLREITRCGEYEVRYDKHDNRLLKRGNLYNKKGVLEGKQSHREETYRKKQHSVPPRALRNGSKYKQPYTHMIYQYACRDQKHMLLQKYQTLEEINELLQKKRYLLYEIDVMINADGVMSGRGIKAPDIMKIRREKKEAMNKTLRFKHVN